MKEVVSTREFEVVETVVRCGSKKDAAIYLNRSLYTIETTVKNVYDKLGINKISDLTLWFCGVKFDIADKIHEFKSLAMVILISSLLLTYGILGTQTKLRRVCFNDESKKDDTIELNMRRTRHLRLKTRSYNLTIHSRSVG